MYRQLNYVHLRSFFAVAHAGSVKDAAHLLNLSQPTLSTQIKALEDRIGQALFHRDGKRLVLSEAGRTCLEYADVIFAAGEELMLAMQSSQSMRRPLRIGALSTLSKNFQVEFLTPILDQDGVEISIQTGDLPALVGQLTSHGLDLVLSNRPPDIREPGLHVHLLSEQSVALVAGEAAGALRLPALMQRYSLILPHRGNTLRDSFDALCHRRGLTARIAAEVDDMATARSLARVMNAATLVPPVVVRDELASGELHILWTDPSLQEQFLALTADRSFPHALVSRLIEDA